MGQRRASFDAAPGRRGGGEGAISEGGFRAVNGCTSGAGHDSDDTYRTIGVSQYFPH